MAVYSKDVQEPTAKGLGIGTNKVQVLNEGDSTKITPLEWMEKNESREVHDILRVQGLNWMASGKGSCWIIMTVASKYGGSL